MDCFSRVTLFCFLNSTRLVFGKITASFVALQSTSLDESFSIRLWLRKGCFDVFLKLNLTGRLRRDNRRWKMWSPSI